jgi:Tfp pilus assembly protein PilN
MTMQGLPERRPRKIDLNLLPPEYLPKKASRLTLGLVIAVIILACIPWGPLIMKSSVDAKNSDLADDLKALTSEYQQGSALVNQCNQKQGEIDACNAQMATMEEEYEIFLNQTYIWSVIMDDVQQTPKGAGGSLGDISQSGSNIAINGQFTKEKYIYEYAVLLNETAHFSQVTLNSIRNVAGETGDMYQFDIQAVLKGGSEE